MHLLRAGVDINTIRAWLGHVSLETTNRYAEVDLEMKAKAVETCAVDGSDPAPIPAPRGFTHPPRKHTLEPPAHGPNRAS